MAIVRQRAPGRMKEAMNILIVGGGSVGLGTASCLLRSGHLVTIAGRPATCRELQAHGGSTMQYGYFDDDLLRKSFGGIAIGDSAPGETAL